METQTPSQYHNRAAFHERAAKAVRAKIEKAYALTPEFTALPSDLANRLAVGFDDTLHSTQWQHTLQVALESSGCTQTLAPAINDIAKRFVQHYAQAFYLNRCVMEVPQEKVPQHYGNFYRWNYTRGTLGGIYTNHISNMAEAELRDAGLNIKSAHAVHGLIIGMTLRLYKANITDFGECAVNPPQGSIKNKTDEQAEAEVRRLASYWREEKFDLEQRYHQFSRCR